jgi:hypothetical protein
MVMMLRRTWLVACAALEQTAAPGSKSTAASAGWD